MTGFPFAIVGFDLDGTLVDSALDLGPAVNHALRLAGRNPVNASQVSQLIGGGARVLLARALSETGGPLPEAEFEPLFAALMDYYRGHIADRTVAYPGCLTVLTKLRSRGCKLAVVTNKAEALTLQLLDALDMTTFFDAVVGGDTLGPGRAKPKPDMIEEAIARCGGGSFTMVGDSTFDVGAARAAKVPSVVVSFGYNDKPPEEFGASAVIDHYDQLIGALERIARDVRDSEAIPSGERSDSSPASAPVR